MKCWEKKGKDGRHVMHSKNGAYTGPRVTPGLSQTPGGTTADHELAQGSKRKRRTQTASSQSPRGTSNEPDVNGPASKKKRTNTVEKPDQAKNVSGGKHSEVSTCSSLEGVQSVMILLQQGHNFSTVTDPRRRYSTATSSSSEQEESPETKARDRHGLDSILQAAQHVESQSESPQSVSVSCHSDTVVGGTTKKVTKNNDSIGVQSSAPNTTGDVAPKQSSPPVTAKDMPRSNRARLFDNLEAWQDERGGTVVGVAKRKEPESPGSNKSLSNHSKSNLAKTPNDLEA